MENPHAMTETDAVIWMRGTTLRQRLGYRDAHQADSAVMLHRSRFSPGLARQRDTEYAAQLARVLMLLVCVASLFGMALSQ